MKNEQMPKRIIMDKKGYNALLLEIEEKKQKLMILRKSMGDISTRSMSDGLAIPEMREIKEDERRLLNQLDTLYEKLKQAEIVEKSNDEEIADIGDILKIAFSMNESPAREMLIKLGGDLTAASEGIQAVSLESPMGKEIYKKRIGEEVTYYVGRNKFDVSILTKENTLEESNNPQR